MNKKIIIIDISVMAVVVLFSIIWIFTTSLKFTHYGYYLLALFRFPYYGYYLFLMYLYTLIKCLYAIIILNKIVKKDKILRSRKYYFYIFPTFILALSYLIFIFITIKELINSEWYKGIDDILRLLSIPLSKGFNYWFPAMNLNIIVCFVIIIGHIIWLINWTLYEEGISKSKLILMNIITPMSVLILYLEILLQFSE
jgi:hypothetical protein